MHGAMRAPRLLVMLVSAWVLASAGCAPQTTQPDAAMDVGADHAGDASADTTACPGDLLHCGASCVDSRFDPANCGACGHACAAGEVCSDGACGLTCVGGSTLCGSRCVDTGSDNANCGACGTVCDAGRACVAGTCALSCASPLVACGATCADTRFDTAHCGACDTACAAGQLCANGSCVAAGECATDSDCGGLTIARCTTAVCNHGAYPGPMNHCVVVPSPSGTTCDDGLFCTTTDRCDGAGACVGSVANTCGMTAPECQQVVCDEVADSCSVANIADGTSCTGSLCDTGSTCTAGACHGTPIVCSGVGPCGPNTCDPATGSCGAPADGTACEDYNLCTTGNACAAGTCGTRMPNCAVFVNESFETCPAGWTLTGEWECGTPMGVGPSSAHSGTGVIATRIAANYANNDAYDMNTASSPPIDLTTAMSPRLVFWAWIDTEGSSFDGFNLSASTDGGTTWTNVTTVTPAYDLTVASRPAWGGHQASAGWQRFHADLSALAGTTARLRFSFRSDGSSTYPGVYIDDVTVTDASADPLQITTTSLPDAATGSPYAATLSRTGGSSAAVWSITGGTNHAWLTIDPATGALSGTPDASISGSVSVTVRVEEPSMPTNFATATFTFSAVTTLYLEQFDGTCPGGWTLGGDWQCGVPMSVGPATAFSPTQCLGTKIAASYSNNQSWTVATATSPDIDLTSVTSARLSMRVWIDTEGSTYDGANLKISTDGGATYTIVTNVTPAYSLTVNTEPAWGGHQASSGWQLVRADLTPYVGHDVRLRVAFRSDGSGTYPGVYVDDVWVTR
jgi:hypothetical protein